jgi:hypothetical protein
MVNDRIDDPSEADVEYYVGLEHLESDSLTIRRWGSPSDVEATKLKFRAGDIIFGRRRVYQRKLAVADFDGICSAHAMVLRAKPAVALPEFLPFFMQSDLFMERAREISVGSLSPTINWKTLAKEEFALPALNEQRRISNVLVTVDQALDALRTCVDNLQLVKRRLRITQFSISTSGVRTDSREQPTWITFGEAVAFSRGLVFRGDQVRNEPSSSTISCVGIPCIGDDERVDERGLVFVADVSPAHAARSQICAGATLLIGSNGNPDRVGNCAYVSEASRRVFGGFLLQAIPALDQLRPKYLFHLLASPQVQAAISEEARGSTGLRNLNLGHLKRFRFNLPTVAEQETFCQFTDAADSGLAFLYERLAALFALRRNLLTRQIGKAG